MRNYESNHLDEEWGLRPSTSWHWRTWNQMETSRCTLQARKTWYLELKYNRSVWYGDHEKDRWACWFYPEDNRWQNAGQISEMTRTNDQITSPDCKRSPRWHRIKLNIFRRRIIVLQNANGPRTGICINSGPFQKNGLRMPNLAGGVDLT